MKVPLGQLTFNKKKTKLKLVKKGKKGTKESNTGTSLREPIT